MMNLILAPNIMLETKVQPFNLGLMHPASFAYDMIDIMMKNHGLGLAANQVGLDAQMFVMRPIINKKHGSALVVVNPIIKSISSNLELGVEGCLSHPGLILKVKRPNSCIVEFDTLTDDGKSVIHIETKFDDLDARVFLHEYDHLQGIQFIDRVSKLKLDMAVKKQTKQRNKNG